MPKKTTVDFGFGFFCIIFYQCLLKETILMEQPYGFEVQGQEHKVCYLRQALSSLKQEARA